VTADLKIQLRKQARARRSVLARGNPDHAQRSASFAAQLPSGVVAGYWPIRDEADPRALMRALEARGAVLALPRIECGTLSFRRWNEGDVLIDNPHGIAEPRAEAEVLAPNLVLVPLLAFDASGHRLGYGGGYYDRVLPDLKAFRIGVAYAGQEVPLLPHEPHDHPLDAVVTEEGVRRFTKRPG
jgi:5-formyltetrahydrofolate cyclo-ligase